MDDKYPDDKYPREALQGDSKDALAAFCELWSLIHRAQRCRYLLRRGRDSQDEFYVWEHMPPDSTEARRRIDLCRPALTVGLYHGLQSKEVRIVDWALYHDRAIERIAPLVEALAKFDESRWSKMDFGQRIDYAGRVLNKLDPWLEFEPGLAYVEAKNAADLLRLPEDDRRIVIDGAYACYRLDWLECGKNSGGAGAAREMKAHVKTIIGIANDLTEYALAVDIAAATTALREIIAFPKSVLFDRFKGHLIEGTTQRLQRRTAAGATGLGGDPPKPAADRTPDVYHTSKWYDEHGPADGRTIRKAIADGHKIRKRKLPNGKNEYAEADVVSRWGAVKKKSD